MSQMYSNIKNKELTFHDHVSNDAKDLIQVNNNFIRNLILNL